MSKSSSLWSTHSRLGGITLTAPTLSYTPTMHTLRHFPTQAKLTRRQARWTELLQEYDFDFKYKRGAENIVPYALSRRQDHREPPSPPISVNALDLQASKNTSNFFCWKIIGKFFLQRRCTL